jgi:hypothetical protein
MHDAAEIGNKIENDSIQNAPRSMFERKKPCRDSKTRKTCDFQKTEH